MGRPTNKRYFGDPADSERNYDAITASVRFDGEAEAEDAYIVRQRSNLRYTFSSLDGERVQNAVLVDKTDIAELEEGEAIIQFTGVEPEEHARIINNRSVKTQEGNVHPWNEGELESIEVPEEEPPQ